METENENQMFVIGLGFCEIRSPNVRSWVGPRFITIAGYRLPKPSSEIYRVCLVIC